MDAFESVVAMLLRREGYWVTEGFKVDLTKEEKRRMRKPTTPRWEIDLLAYKACPDEVLVMECKSLLDSAGVIFRNGAFEPENRYKLFADKNLRKVVLQSLKAQLIRLGSCTPSTRVTLCLAAGHIGGKTDRGALDEYFCKNEWRLLDRDWICKGLRQAADHGYENDIAVVVAKFHSQTGKRPTSGNSRVAGDNT